MNDPFESTPVRAEEGARRASRPFGGGFVLLVVLAVLAFSGNALAGAAAQEKRTLVISFQSTAIVVEGVTPRANVILFGIERKASGYATRTTDVFLTVESDQQGAARFDLQPTIGARSIYAAVDAVRGDYVISSPQPEAVNVSPAHMMRMKGKAGLEFEGFDLDSQWIEAICVRPGNGSWRVSMMDGSSVDESAVHGTVQVGAGRMKAIGNGPTSPVRFRPRDVLIAIDPYTMTVVATAVDE